MKKKKIMTGMAVGAALAGLMLGGCGGGGAQGLYGPPPEDLYGPPPDTDYYEESETDVDENDFSSEQTLYGPPADETTTQDETVSDGTLAPSEEDTVQPLYGAPPDVES